MPQTNARRVVANITLSLDGRTTGPGGEYDMGWIVPHAVTDAARDGLLGLTSATTALLGRKNYQGFGSYWPTVAQDENADPRDRTFVQTSLKSCRRLHHVLPRRPHFLITDYLSNVKSPAETRESHQKFCQD